MLALGRIFFYMVFWLLMVMYYLGLKLSRERLLGFLPSLGFPGYTLMFLCCVLVSIVDG
jgi:hypothetical protein